jgi:hypothetical protein
MDENDVKVITIKPVVWSSKRKVQSMARYIFQNRQGLNIFFKQPNTHTKKDIFWQTLCRSKFFQTYPTTKWSSDSTIIGLQDLQTQINVIFTSHERPKANISPIESNVKEMRTFSQTVMLNCLPSEISGSHSSEDVDATWSQRNAGNHLQDHAASQPRTP